MNTKIKLEHSLSPKDNRIPNSDSVELTPITANHNNERLKKGMCRLTSPHKKKKTFMDSPPCRLLRLLCK